MSDPTTQLENEISRRTDVEVVARRLIDEGFNQGRLTVADELIAHDLIEHQNYGPQHAPGPSGVKAVILSLRSAFSDFHLRIEDVAINGELVWLRSVATGTHAGPYMGRPPTGLPIRVEVFDVLRVHAGQVVEHWGVPDRLGALQQIGAGAANGSSIGI